MAKTTLQYCPQCRTGLRGASAVREGDADPAPTPGCVTVCLYCAAVLRWNERGALVRCLQEDFAALPKQVQQDLRRLVAGLKRGGPMVELVRAETLKKGSK